MGLQAEGARAFDALVSGDCQARVGCQLWPGPVLQRGVQHKVVADMTVVAALAAVAHIGKRRQQLLRQVQVSVIADRCAKLPFQRATQGMVGFDVRPLAGAMLAKHLLGLFEKRVKIR